MQTRSATTFPFCAVQQDQVTLNDDNCSRVAIGAETSPGQSSVAFHGATVGQFLVISVKYSLKVLVGTYMDESMGCHYDFRTEVNGQVVDSDPDGLQIGEATQVSDGGSDGSGSGANGSGDGGDVDRQRGSGDGTGTSSPPGPGATGGTGVNAGAAGTASNAGSEAGSQGATLDAINLERAVPNPFSDGMRMTYDVGTTSAQVTISVYDLAGRQVRALASGTQAAGRHAVAWDGRDEQGSRVRKGMYFVHMRIGERTKQVRVTFLQ